MICNKCSSPFHLLIFLSVLQDIRANFSPEQTTPFIYIHYMYCCLLMYSLQKQFYKDIHFLHGHLQLPYAMYFPAIRSNGHCITSRLMFRVLIC